MYIKRNIFLSSFVCASFKWLVFNRLKERSQSTKRAFPVKCIRRFAPRVEESNLGQLCVLWWMSEGAKLVLMLRKETQTDYALNGNLNIKMFLRKQKQTTHQIKSGTEPRWKINSRDLRFEKWGLIFGPFFWSGTKYQFGSSFVPASLLQFLSGLAGHAKIPTEVQEDSRVFRVHRLWFPTSNRLDTWLIPSGMTRSRQYDVLYCQLWGNLPLYHLLKFLLALCHALVVWKDKTKY